MAHVLRTTMVYRNNERVYGSIAMVIPNDEKDLRLLPEYRTGNATIEQAVFSIPNLGMVRSGICERNRILYAELAARVLANTTELGSAINVHNGHARGFIYTPRGPRKVYGDFPGSSAIHAGRAN